MRLAFLGCDSTHTEAYGREVLNLSRKLNRRISVETIYGEDLLQARAKAKALEIPRVCPTIEAALDGVDFAMVLGRFGDSHFDPALAAIRYGLPTFVDKPFTTSLPQARLIATAALEAGVPLCSSSPLRFSQEVSDLKKKILCGDGSDLASIVVMAPENCIDIGDDYRFNSSFFYGIHGIEVLFELVGHDFKRTTLITGGSSSCVYFETPAFKTVSLQLVRGTTEFYSISAFFKDSLHFSNINLDGSYYRATLMHLLDEFLPGKNRIPIESTIAAIEVLQAIDDLRGDVK